MSTNKEILLSYIFVLLRWIMLFPGALLCSTVVCISLSIICRFILCLQGFNPDSLIEKIMVTIIPQAISGFAFVHTGCKISPSHKRGVAYVLGCIALILTGSIMHLALSTNDYWKLSGNLAFILGSSLTMYSISTEELGINNLTSIKDNVD